MRQGFDLDEKNKFQTDQIAKFDPLARQIYGDKSDKGMDYSTLTRYMINAATQGTTDQKVVDTRLGELRKLLSAPLAGKALGGMIAPSSANLSTKPVLPPRSKTVSPGISKDGKRINY
jgi:hypothetical protein